MSSGFVTVSELKPSPSFRRFYVLLYLFGTGMLMASSADEWMKLILFFLLTGYCYKYFRLALPQVELKSFSLEKERLILNNSIFPMARIKVVMKNSFYHWLSITDRSGKKHRLFFFNDQLTTQQLTSLSDYLTSERNLLNAGK